MNAAAVARRLLVPTLVAAGASVAGAEHLPAWSATAAGLVVFGLLGWASLRIAEPEPDIVLPPGRGSGRAALRRAWPVIGVFGLAAGLVAWGILGGADPRSLPVSAAVGAAALLGGAFLVLACAAEADREQAMRDARRVLDEADALARRADRQLADGRAADALAAYEAALERQRRYRPASHLAVVEPLVGVARALLRFRRFGEGLARAREARALLDARARRSTETAPIAVVTAGVERSMGEACLRLEAYEEAALHFGDAVRIWDRLIRETPVDALVEATGGETGAELPIFDDLGRLVLATALAGDVERASAEEERLLALETDWAGSRGLGPEALAGLAADARLEGIASVFWQPVRGIRRFQRAAAFDGAVRGTPAAASHEALGLGWEEAGAFAMARRHYERALALRAASGAPSPESSGVLRRLGGLAARGGDHDEAARLFDRALAAARSGADDQEIGWSCIGRSEAALALGDPARADALAREVLRLGAGDSPRARAYSVLAELRARAGGREAAILLGKRAARLVQERRRGLTGSVLEDDLPDFEAVILRRLAGHLVDAGRLSEAQQILDMLKEQEFETHVTRKAGGAPASPLPRLTGHELAWTRHGDEIEASLASLSAERRLLLSKVGRDAAQAARLEALHARLDRAKQELDAWLDAFVDRLRTERPTAQDLVGALNLDLLETLRADLAELGPNVALAHFILGPERLAIILTKADLQVSRDVAVTDVEMHGLVHRFRRAMRAPGRDRADLTRLGQALHDRLIAPVAEHLAGVETLMVVLDGALRYLPLAALHDGTGYLVARHALATLTPASYTRLKDRPYDWSAGGVGGLGVSRRVSADHAPLAAVDDELRAIIREGGETSGVFPGRRYLDEAFTATAFAEALQAHKAVHIASHFDFAGIHDGDSSLLLGDGTSLTLRQMSAERYVFRNVELVTLSACETGLGRDPGEAATCPGQRRWNGAEFESLGAMIQKRGAKSVIATLWAVEDGSTARLMRRFYEERRGGRTKAAALRSAQMALAAGDGSDAAHAHPYFWAPFVLMGNWL